jgi:hypothetical protein
MADKDPIVEEVWNNMADWKAFLSISKNKNRNIRKGLLIREVLKKQSREARDVHFASLDVSLYMGRSAKR